jgi:hypothetical protein
MLHVTMLIVMAPLKNSYYNSQNVWAFSLNFELFKSIFCLADMVDNAKQC